jgi:hypothetical protein
MMPTYLEELWKKAPFMNTPRVTCGFPTPSWSTFLICPEICSFSCARFGGLFVFTRLWLSTGTHLCALVQSTAWTLSRHDAVCRIYSVVVRSNKKRVYEKQVPRRLSQQPFYMYLGLSCLRAVDFGMTNMAMQYVNYPTMTLMKRARVIFTMLFGVLITRKRYKSLDYVVVVLVMTGLAMFMHADAVFSHVGIVMLVSFFRILRMLSPLFCTPILTTPASTHHTHLFALLTIDYFINVCWCNFQHVTIDHEPV